MSPQSFSLVSPSFSNNTKEKNTCWDYEKSFYTEGYWDQRMCEFVL